MPIFENIQDIDSALYVTAVGDTNHLSTLTVDTDYTLHYDISSFNTFTSAALYEFTYYSSAFIKTDITTSSTKTLHYKLDLVNGYEVKVYVLRIVMSSGIV